LSDLLKGAKLTVDQIGSKNLVAFMRFVGRDKIQVTKEFIPAVNVVDSHFAMFEIEGGQTALVDAIYIGVQLVAAQDNKSGEYRKGVVIISDGEERDSGRSERELFELLEKENVPVFFVGLIDTLPSDSGFTAKSPRAKAKELIERVTTDTGGVAIYPKTGRIGDAGKAIGALLDRRYILTTPLASPSSARPKVVVELAKNSKRKNITFHVSR
jgi:hypothetical protein